MNHIILHIFAVGFCFGIGHALQCYNCDISLFNLCLYTKTTCAAGEQCYSGTGKAAGFVDVKVKGCLNPSLCNTTTDINFPANSNTTLYIIYKTCCSTDLCNSAPGLPRLGALPLAIATLVVFLTKALA